MYMSVFIKAMKTDGRTFTKHIIKSQVAQARKFTYSSTPFQPGLLPYMNYTKYTTELPDPYVCAAPDGYGFSGFQPFWS